MSSLIELVRQEPRFEPTSWMVDDITPHEWRALRALSGLAQLDPSLGKTALGFPWVADDITSHKLSALQLLQIITEVDASLGKSVMDFPWLHDDLAGGEVSALRALNGLAGVDVSLAKTVLAYPWVADGITENEPGALRALSELAQLDVSLGKTAAGWPWVVDEITEDERWSLRYIRDVAARDLPLGKTLGDFPWVQDEITKDDTSALRNLTGFAEQSVALTKIAAGFPWVSDGVTNNESDALRSLAGLAKQDASIARKVLGLSWVGDDITENESVALKNLKHLSEQDRSLAKRVADMPFLTGSFQDHDYSALGTLVYLQRFRPKDLALLVGQDWFLDGLTDDEASVVTVLIREVGYFTPGELRDFLLSHYVKSKTINLPLAGETILTVIQTSPEADNRYTATQVEEAVRATEEFIGVPFPMDEVILLFLAGQAVGVPLSEPRTGALHRGTHMVVYPSGGTHRLLIHEAAHYYWRFNVPLWFREGGSDFLASYVRDKLYGDSLQEDVRRIRICNEMGMTTIQKLINHLEAAGYAAHRKTSNFSCNYARGEDLFLKLFKTIGPGPFRAAWKEIYQLSKQEDHPITEIEIYQAFLRHTPQATVEEFKKLYASLHGGDFGDDPP